MKKPAKPVAVKPGDEAPLQLPHERDQDPDMTNDRPDPVIRQAYEDLKNGQVDTDMRATPGQDARKRARDVPGPGGQPPRKAETGVRRK